MGNMLSHILSLIFLFTFSSCALFKSHNIKDKKIVSLLESVRVIGEGKGRLGIDNHQYLFSFDAILKDKSTWILAANIPIHGEEVLIFADLLKPIVESEGRDPLELRIEKGIADYLKQKKQSPRLAGLFIQELRGIIRFLLNQELGIQISCQFEGEAEYCQDGHNRYLAEADAKKLSLKKNIGDFQIEYVAQNLTESIFAKSSVYLYSKNTNDKQDTLLSLELFWK
jgi:hypothetical protein